MAKEKKKKEKKVIVRKTLEIKKKKKKWASIYAPKDIGNIVLGETLIADTKELMNKRVTVSLSQLGKGKNPNIKAIFEVIKLEEGNGLTELFGYHILDSYARRIVKKGKTKIFKSYKLKTKNDINVILKIIFVTKSKINSKVNKDLGKEIDSYISKEVNKNSFESNINSIIDYKFQKEIKDHLKKIYPISSIEVLVFKKG